MAPHTAQQSIRSTTAHGSNTSAELMGNETALIYCIPSVQVKPQINAWSCSRLKSKQPRLPLVCCWLECTPVRLWAKSSLKRTPLPVSSGVEILTALLERSEEVLDQKVLLLGLQALASEEHWTQNPETCLHHQPEAFGLSCVHTA